MTEALQRFAALVRRPADEVDLAAAALAFAAVVDVRVDAEAALAVLDRLAVGVEGFGGLRRRLFAEQGFRGVTDGYHRPESSLLHHVLARRRGNPITLSVVTMEVGRRAGVPVQGVGMPGHFLIRDPGTGQLCDPFHSGTMVDGQAAGWHGSGSTTSGAPLPIVDAHQILTRMLANLAGAYRREGRTGALEDVLRCQRAVPGAAAGAAVQLGELLSARGHFAMAAQELEEAADALPGGDGDALRAAAVGLRARLN